MIKLIICDKKRKQAINEILNNDKYIVISINSSEGITTEINNNLNYFELFNVYKKFRKKYFKLKR